MDCAEFKELTPAFALGALEESDRAACAAHLVGGGTHDGCTEALGEAQAVAALLASLLPPRQPSSRVWDAIEAGIAARTRAPEEARPAPAARRTPPPAPARRVWRELGGWFVAAAVTGFYLYNAPVDSARKADAAFGSPAAMNRAAELLMDGNTRHYVFRAPPGGAPSGTTARGSLVVSASLRDAVVLVERVVLEPGMGLRLWAVRGTAAPVPLARLDATVDGMATAELGDTLFLPALPDELLLSIDPQDAAAPRSVLLVARLDRP
jgi:hypothetical protein